MKLEPPASAVSQRQPIAIDCDFPGGNIAFLGIDNDVVRLRPDPRDTDGKWFYWYFRVRGAQGRSLSFDFAEELAVGVHGPAISDDNGLTWRWGGKQNATNTSFNYKFGPNDKDVRFSVGVPYLAQDLDRWLASARVQGRLQLDSLCKSHNGCDVPLLRLGSTEPHAPAIILTARHHCCEAMASFVLEGFLDYVLSDTWFDENVAVLAIPFVDYDGVQAGDQGKNRKPHDHNRDYGVGLYPEIRAICNLVSSFPAAAAAAFDLHCPWLFGVESNQHIYIVGAHDPQLWARQLAFAAEIEKVCKTGLPYFASESLPFGTSWNNKSMWASGVECARWMGQAGVPLACGIEMPYADVRGVIATPSAVRDFGGRLGRAIKSYLISAANGS